jgi:hypothetical protein
MQPHPEPPRRTPPTRADEQLASLRARHPGWHLWHVLNYQANNHTWCGMPDGAITGELQAHSPEALTERITEYEATLDAHIDQTREQLASLPPTRPETQAQRRVLDARLEAQLRLQKRRVPT